MVFIRHKPDPAKTQARLNVSLSTSPTLSLSDPNAILNLTLTLSIDHATPAREGTPLTLCTERSVLSVTYPGEGGIDILARGGFGRLRSCDTSSSSQGDEANSNAKAKHISLGFFRVNGRPKSTSPDLREREYRFVTVPAAAGSVVSITHPLSWERIFRYEEKRTKEDLVPGEKFAVSISKGYLGTIWWCWGDLDADLEGKKFHTWHKSELSYQEEKPNDEFVREGNWVLGEDPMRLEWNDVTEGGSAIFEIVE